jgi:hypothetical protein
LEVGVLGETAVELLFCPEGALLVLPVDAVDLVECALVAGAHCHLLAGRFPLPLRLLLVELLQLLPQLVGGLLLQLPAAPLLVLELLVGGLEVLLVVGRLLRLLPLQLLLVLRHLLRRG